MIGFSQVKIIEWELPKLPEDKFKCFIYPRRDLNDDNYDTIIRTKINELQQKMKVLESGKIYSLNDVLQFKTEIYKGDLIRLHYDKNGFKYDFDEWEDNMGGPDGDCYSHVFTFCKCKYEAIPELKNWKLGDLLYYLSSITNKTVQDISIKDLKLPIDKSEVEILKEGLNAILLKLK